MPPFLSAVGIVAFGNVTYTSWGGVVGSAFDLLAETGALQPRVPQPSTALVNARDAVSQLILNWDDKKAEKGADVPIKLDDHSMDAARYALHTTQAAWAPLLEPVPAY